MRLLIGALIVGVALAFMLMSLSDEMTIYTDFQTAQKNPSKTYHVVVEWIDRSESYYDPQRDLFSFKAKDTLGTVQWVHYPDPKPINFDAAQKVVLIGYYKDTAFYAEKILMKCPSKYKDQGSTLSYRENSP